VNFKNNYKKINKTKQKKSETDKKIKYK